MDIRADLILGLGVAVCRDGSAGAATTAVADEVVRLYRAGVAPRILLSGGYSQAGVSEAEAMRRLLVDQGIDEAVWVDAAPDHILGTPYQPRSAAAMFSNHFPSVPQRIVLVGHPLHLPRALWLFRRAFPNITITPAPSREVYDALLSQRRLHARWRFMLWNCAAWIHHLIFLRQISSLQPKRH